MFVHICIYKHIYVYATVYERLRTHTLHINTCVYTCLHTGASDEPVVQTCVEEFGRSAKQSSLHWAPVPEGQLRLEGQADPSQLPDVDALGSRAAKLQSLIRGPAYS